MFQHSKQARHGST